MRLISYTSQAFASISAVFDYLAENVPWLTSEAGGTLKVGNLTLEKSATTAIKITDSGGATLTTPTVNNFDINYIIAITDTSVIVCQNTAGQVTAMSSFVIGKATDGSAAAMTRIETSSGSAETVLTHGAVNVSSNGTRKIISSGNITQLVPAYSNETTLGLADAYLVFMTPNTSYLGKMELENAKYVQCLGLALRYSVD